MSHSHSHDHQHGANTAAKTLWIAVIITLFFAGVEAFFGWFAHSLALLSDAGHMLADSLTLVMAAIAAIIAARPPSRKHSYGLGRAEVIAALISSLFILLVVIGIAVEAVNRLQHPKPVAGGIVMIVAFIGLVVNVVIAYILSRGEKTLNMRAALLHVIGDLLGSVAALLSGAIIYYTHWDPIDPILSFFICVLILISSLRILRDTFSVLMEGVPSHLDLASIGYRMASVKNVKSVHDLHVWTLSSGMIVLTAHVLIINLKQWQTVLADLQQLLQQEFHIEHVTLQPEVITEEIIQLKIPSQE